LRYFWIFDILFTVERRITLSIKQRKERKMSAYLDDFMPIDAAYFGGDDGYDPDFDMDDEGWGNSDY